MRKREKNKNKLPSLDRNILTMSFLSGLFGLLKKLAIFVLILAVAIPLRYGSTNRQYLTIRCLHSILSLKHSLLPDNTRPTLSADYRAFEEILRMKPLAKIDPLADPLTVIEEMRSEFKIGTIVPVQSGCRINKEVFDHDGKTVGVYWIDHSPTALQTNADKILLYFHGGGYTFGDIQSYSGFECHLSQLFNMTILHVEYRLCPEHPLPAAVDDAVAVYRALLRDNISPSQLMIMGDSAGGGLTLLTIQALLANQLPIPRGVIVLSPWTDVSASGESYKRNHLTDIMISYESITWIAKQLLGLNPSQLLADNPKFSPLFGSFEGFPPMYINMGTAEVLEDDSRRVLKKAEEAGIDVTFEEGLHLMHVYALFFPYYPEARNTLDNINKWIQTIFDQKLTK